MMKRPAELARRADKLDSKKGAANACACVYYVICHVERIFLGRKMFFFLNTFRAVFQVCVTMCEGKYKSIEKDHCRMLCMLTNNSKPVDM